MNKFTLFLSAAVASTATLFSTGCVTTGTGGDSIIAPQDAALVLVVLDVVDLFNSEEDPTPADFDQLFGHIDDFIYYNPDIPEDTKDGLRFAVSVAQTAITNGEDFDDIVSVLSASLRALLEAELDRLEDEGGISEDDAEDFRAIPTEGEE